MNNEYDEQETTWTCMYCGKKQTEHFLKNKKMLECEKCKKLNDLWYEERKKLW